MIPLKKIKSSLVRNKKSTLFLIGLLLFLILLILLNKIFAPEKETQVINNNQIIPNDNENTLQLISINPPAGKHQTAISTYPIKFNFNEKIATDSIKIKTDFPRKIDIELEDNQKTIAFYPHVGWELKGSQTITLVTAVSIENHPLSSPIEYTFSLAFPEEKIEFDEPDF